MPFSHPKTEGDDLILLDITILINSLLLLAILEVHHLVNEDNAVELMR